MIDPVNTWNLSLCSHACKQTLEPQAKHWYVLGKKKIGCELLIGRIKEKGDILR